MISNSISNSSSLSLHLLLAQNLHALHSNIVIRRWLIFLLSLQTLIPRFSLASTKFHPQDYDCLSDQHTNSTSRHSERYTNQDRHEYYLYGCRHYHSHTAKEALVVVMMKFEAALGLEMNVAGEFHSPIWAAVRGARVLTTFMMRVGMVGLFVSGDGVDAFDAETLHFVDGALGGSFDFVHIVEDFGEEAAEDVFTFGVRGIGGGRDESYGVEG